jgi:hypothetical protein
MMRPDPTSTGIEGRHGSAQAQGPAPGMSVERIEPAPTEIAAQDFFAI